MGERLGKVIYWAFCIFAVLWLAFGLWSDGGDISAWDMSVFLLILGGGIVLWVIGAAARYLLAEQ